MSLCKGFFLVFLEYKVVVQCDILENRAPEYPLRVQNSNDSQFIKFKRSICMTIVRWFLRDYHRGSSPFFLYCYLLVKAKNEMLCGILLGFWEKYTLDLMEYLYIKWMLYLTGELCLNRIRYLFGRDSHVSS